MCCDDGGRSDRHKLNWTPTLSLSMSYVSSPRSIILLITAFILLITRSTGFRNCPLRQIQSIKLSHLPQLLCNQHFKTCCTTHHTTISLYEHQEWTEGEIER
jgi:hypothetical protein